MRWMHKAWLRKPEPELYAFFGPFLRRLGAGTPAPPKRSNSYRILVRLLVAAGKARADVRTARRRPDCWGSIGRGEAWFLAAHIRAHVSGNWRRPGSWPRRIAAPVLVFPRQW